MPKTLDVLIGLATIMLFFSLAVTTLTQMVVGLLNLRGRSLLTGIVRLLQQVWPQLNDDHAQHLANYLLRHPAIAIKGALGNVVHREEMVMLLLEAAAGETPAGISEEVRQSLMTELGQSGIPNGRRTTPSKQRYSIDA